MARKTRIAAAIERAQKSLTSQIFAAAMAEVPGRTPLGEVMAVLRKEGFSKHLDTMTLSDFLAAAGGAAPARRGPGRPAGSRNVARAKPVGGRAKQSFNTRTEPGRQALDAAIAEFLSAAGSARAEAIRGSLGASPAQIRQSMARLMSAGKVSRKGQKRGTEYHWQSGRASAKPVARKATKAAGKKPKRGAKRRARAQKAKARAAKG